ncbi:PAS domain-containing protein [Desulfovibrio litoralis]|nr:PAS domain S-box protein [Desulfovibrio litoralis]
MRQALETSNSEIAQLSHIVAQGEVEWQALFSTIQEGIAIQYDGYILNVNNHLAYMVGVEKSELVGSELSRLLFRDDRDIFAHSVASLRSGLETPKIQVRFRTVSGDLRSVVVDIQRFTYLEKQCEIVFFLESPHHEVPYNQPVSKEQHFIALVEELDDMFAVFDMHGVLQWGNAAWRSFWGTNGGVELGSYALFQDPNYNSTELKNCLERISSGLSSRLNSVAMTGSKGYSRILNMRFSPVFEAGTNSSVQCGFAVIQADVTEFESLKSDLKGADEDLKKFSLKMRDFIDKQNDVFNSMSSVFILVSTQGIITHWNRAAEIKFDILRSHALGQSVSILSNFFNDITNAVNSVAKDGTRIQLCATSGECLLLSPCVDRKTVILEIFT